MSFGYLESMEQCVAALERSGLPIYPLTGKDLDEKFKVKCKYKCIKYYSLDYWNLPECSLICSIIGFAWKNLTLYMI
jgi:hypothetical protein